MSSKQENREKFNEIKAQGKIALRQKMKEKAKKEKKRRSDKTKRITDMRKISNE